MQPMVLEDLPTKLAHIWGKFLGKSDPPWVASGRAETIPRVAAVLEALASVVASCWQTAACFLPLGHEASKAG